MLQLFLKKNGFLNITFENCCTYILKLIYGIEMSNDTGNLSDTEKEKNGFSLSAELYKETTLIISVSGNLETDNSTIFLNSILNIISSSHCRLFILDLGKLNYVSSTGIGALTTVISEVKKLSRLVYFMYLNTKVYSIIELLGFTNFFLILNNRDELDSKIREIKNSP